MENRVRSIVSFLAPREVTPSTEKASVLYYSEEGTSNPAFFSLAPVPVSSIPVSCFATTR